MKPFYSLYIQANFITSLSHLGRRKTRTHCQLKAFEFVVRGSIGERMCPHYIYDKKTFDLLTLLMLIEIILRN